jgi:hypothetical protein
VAERLTALLGLVVAMASLVLLYGIVLHLALWALGRRWRAPDPEAQAACDQLGQGPSGAILRRLEPLLWRGSTTVVQTVAPAGGR